MTRDLLLLCGLWLCACGKDASSEPSEPVSPCGAHSGVVQRVLDGDTIELSDATKIRYLQVNTPEISHAADEVAECFGDDAKAFNESLVAGQTVTLEYDVGCTDRYGRTLAFVSVDGRMVNKLLVERGYGRVLIIEPNLKYADEFRALEAEAQAQSAGLWGACE